MKNGVAGIQETKQTKIAFDRKGGYKGIKNESGLKLGKQSIL